MIDGFRLDGRRALVTGASRGIGRSIAEAFAEAGADVALAARTVPDLEMVAEAVEAHGCRAVVLPLDVRDVASVEKAVAKATEALGGLDILVNNAGVYFHATVAELTPEEFQLVIDVNLRAAVFAMQAARPLMRDSGGGVVINISSVAAEKGTPNVYGASKAALESFTRGADRDWALDNIRCVAIAPGMIDTDMEAEVMADPARIDPVIASTARRRVAQPGEVAAAAVYLASQSADFVSGAVLNVDGGRSANY
ncbi:MAG: glucose 1-dehydrogenase [Chloroflexi bacterium]|nr:glucose 1-dehydrogenase [Chloroflexota bacterium]